MRRQTVRVAVALFTLALGISAAGAWESLVGRLAAGAPVGVAAPEFQPLAAAPEPSSVREIQEILRRYDEAQTRHDAAFFERIEADGFILTDEYGKTRNRAQAIASMHTWDRNLKYTTDRVEVRPYGDAAIVTGRMTAEHTIQGNSWSWQFIDVFAKRDGRWQILSTYLVN